MNIINDNDIFTYTVTETNQNILLLCYLRNSINSGNFLFQLIVLLKPQWEKEKLNFQFNKCIVCGAVLRNKGAHSAQSRYFFFLSNLQYYGLI